MCFHYLQARWLTVRVILCILNNEISIGMLIEQTVRQTFSGTSFNSPFDALLEKLSVYTTTTTRSMKEAKLEEKHASFPNSRASRVNTL